MDHITIGTYNATGLGADKRKFIKKLLDDVDVLFLTEHWLHKGDLGELDDLHADCVGTGCTGMPESKLHTVGRPYGGSGLVYKTSISHKIRYIDSGGKNICALMLGNILMINAYMPCDNYKKNTVTNDFQNAVSSIEDIILANPHEALIVGGDMNVDLSRNVAHTKHLVDFSHRHNLFFVKTHLLAQYDVTYRQYRGDGISKSCVDHFLVSEDIYDRISSIECEENRIENASGHTPIIVKFPHSLSRNPTPAVDENMPDHNSPPKIAWHKVNDNHTRIYQQIIENALKSRIIPPAIFCNEKNCTDETHTHQLDDYCDFLVNTCLNAADQCLPKCRKSNGKPKSTPYWSEEIGAMREQALESDWIWCATGKPTNGQIYDDMRRDRRRYHFAIRQNKRDDEALRNKRLGEHFAAGRQGDVWKELKKTSNNKKPSNIDGMVDDDEIVNLFAEKNRNLYNSVPSDPSLITALKQRIQRDIDLGTYNYKKFNVKNVVNSVRKSKKGKSDGDKGFTSDHLKHVPDVFYVHLSLMYNAFVCHGHIPQLLLRGTVTHIPKDLRGKLNESINYRGIVLCICLMKVFEDMIVTVYHDIFKTSDLQFSYKKGHSTSTATLTLKELIRYYRVRGSKVYAVSLDASKAFDRVRHDRLFDILYRRGLPPIVLRTVMYMYENQESRCRYFLAHSEYYRLSNGTRQGGVASPILFLVYMDELYKKLVLAGFGLYMGTVFMGVIGYADDMLLLATNLYSLNKMLKICEQFGREFDVMYNPTKSKCIVFGEKKMTTLTASMYGSIIPKVNELLYLGNLMAADCLDKADVSEKCSDLNSRTNSLVHKFSLLNRNAKCMLFKSKCSHAYGSETWDLAAKDVIMYLKAVGQAGRRVLGLPPCCPSTIVNTLFNCDVSKSHTYTKALSLIKTFQKSSNEIMSCIFVNAINDCNSYISRNLNVIREAWGGDESPPFIPDQSPICVGIMELLDVREGAALIELDHEDVDELMMLLCSR